MKTYLKENYPTVKRRAQNTLDDFDNHKVIYVSIWIVPIVIGIAWWKVLIGFFIMHYTAGLIQYRISIGTLWKRQITHLKRIRRNG
jgi:linoleoyl-CoA desaturase